MVCGCSRDRKMNERSSATGQPPASWESSSRISRRICSRSAEASDPLSSERAGLFAGPPPPAVADRSFRWLDATGYGGRSEEHTSELQSHVNLVCRLLLE